MLWVVADCVDEIDAQRVFGYALYKDGKNARLSYPLQKFDADVTGRSFHNGRFIQRMREKASSLPKYKFQLESSKFIFNPSFTSSYCLSHPNSMQCKTRARNCHISTRRKWNRRRGALQNQEWTRAHSKGSPHHSMWWLFFQLEAFSLQPKGNHRSFNYYIRKVGSDLWDVTRVTFLNYFLFPN